MKGLNLKSLCFALVLSIFVAVLAPVSAFALDYPELQLGKTEKGNLSDYYGSVKYSLNLKRDYKIKFSYSSSVKSKIVVRDSGFNKVLESKETKKFVETVFLKKGSYKVSLYNSTFKSGTYTLKASDATEYAEKIEFYSSKYYLSVGGSINLPLKCIPDGTQAGDIKWSSSNKKIATVDKNGKVTGKSLGAVSVTAKLSNGASATTTVCVNMRTYKIKKGKSKTLPKINLKSVSWKNKNPKIVKIKKGKFIGKSKGKAALSKTVGKNKYKVVITVV